MREQIPNPLHDPRAEAVLARLHAQGDREFKYLVSHGLTSMVRHWVIRRDMGINWTFLRDKLVRRHSGKCRLAHVLCRSPQPGQQISVDAVGLQGRRGAVRKGLSRLRKNLVMWNDTPIPAPVHWVIQ